MKGKGDDQAFKAFGSSFDNRCTLDPATIKSTSDFFELYSKSSSGTFNKISAKVTYSPLFTDQVEISRFYIYEHQFYVPINLTLLF